MGGPSRRARPKLSSYKMFGARLHGTAHLRGSRLWRGAFLAVDKSLVETDRVRRRARRACWICSRVESGHSIPTRRAAMPMKAHAAGKGFPTPDGYIAAIAAAHDFVVASRRCQRVRGGWPHCHRPLDRCRVKRHDAVGEHDQTARSEAAGLSPNGTTSVVIGRIAPQSAVGGNTRHGRSPSLGPVCPVWTTRM
jgi:hypothetical protein